MTDKILELACANGLKAYDFCNSHNIIAFAAALLADKELEIADLRSQHAAQMQTNNKRFEQFERALADNVESRVKAQQEIATLKARIDESRNIY